MRTFLLFLWTLSLAFSSHAQDLSTAPLSLGESMDQEQQSFLPVEQAFQVQVFIDNQADANNRPLNQLQLLWNIAPEYYLYKHRFKLSADIDGKTVTLTPSFPTKGISKYDEYFEKELEVFYNNVELRATLPTNSPPLNLSVQSQGCADAGLCYPPQTQQFSIDTQSGQILPIDTKNGQKGPTSQVQTPPPIEPAQNSWLPYVLLLAIAGGIILNLMPCVFPVLSIKALSMAGAHQSNHSQHQHGWMYTAGAVSAFVVVAALMLIARAGGQAVGWGFQLQSPVLVSLLAYLFFAMGLSLSGLVTFGTRLMGMGQNLTDGHGLRSSFFTGVLAAVVASPCTAPFMGTALGYALTQPAVVSLTIFAALGFGMALPFLILSYVPHLGKYLPKPGPWMETLRQSLAFPLYLAAIWLLWVLGRQAGSDSVALVCIGALLIAFALWVSHHPIKRKVVQGLMVSASMVAALTIPFGLSTINTASKTVTAEEQGRWQSYSPDKLSQLRAEGRPVFVNLTADWCLTCLANERLTLHVDAVEKAFENHQVTTMKGDWTNYNADITHLLNQYGRSGVPLYLMFPADGQEPAKILPQLLTQEVLLEAIKASASSAQPTKKNTFAAYN